MEWRSTANFSVFISLKNEFLPFSLLRKAEKSKPETTSGDPGAEAKGRSSPENKLR